MSEIINMGWIRDNNGDKFAPKTLISQVQTNDGVLLDDKLQTDMNTLKDEVKAYADTVASNKSDKNHNHDDLYEKKEDADAKLNEAKGYTDGKILAEANAREEGDKETLNSAKSYTDEKVSGKADSSHTHETYETKEDAQVKYDIITDAKADWNQNDETAIDYVKNRTHWVEESLFTLVDETMEGSVNYINEFSNEMVTVGDTYIVTVDSVKYSCVAYGYETEYATCVFIGDSRLYPSFDEEGNPFINEAHPEDVPFVIEYMHELSMNMWESTHDFCFYYSDSDIHTIKIEYIDLENSTYHKLDENFIPDTIARKDYVDENFALKSDVKDVDLSNYETKVDAQTKYDELKDTKAEKVHTHVWNDLEDKPFGEREVKNYILTSTTFTFTYSGMIIDSSGYNADLVSSIISENGNGGNNFPLIAILNGVQYDGLVKQGGIYILNENGSDLFSLRMTGNTLRVMGGSITSGTYTLEIFYVENGIMTLDEKYIPDSIARTSNVMKKNNPVGTGSFSMNRKSSTYIGKYSFAEGNNTTASGYASHAEGYMTTASGEYSHSEGYETKASTKYTHAEGYNTTASNIASHAEGDDTTASGYASHSEGHQTTASGYASHAEGWKTEASGDYSHTEGQETVASEEWSHAEGYNTTASGQSSHSEGNNTTASGYASHSEGGATTASGGYSHAEGYNTTASRHASHSEGHGTIASGEYQHVQGKYNIEDTSDTYAHIVGNGESDSERSNAHTLDWSGNAWFAGDVYVGSTSGTNKDEGSRKLATAPTLITIPKGRMRGDVDGDGKITHTDAYIASQHVGKKEILTDEIAIWCIDTNGDGNCKVTDPFDISRFAGGETTTLQSMADYYGNWTWDGTSRFYRDITVSGMTAGNSAIINIQDAYEPDNFSAECFDGYLRLYAKLCPINDVKAFVQFMTGDGTVIIVSEGTDCRTASDKSFGSVKLYTETGDKQDGTMSQKAITDAFDNYELVTIEHIDTICGGVTEGSLAQSDIDELMSQLQ